MDVSLVPFLCAKEMNRKKAMLSGGWFGKGGCFFGSFSLRQRNEHKNLLSRAVYSSLLK